MLMMKDCGRGDNAVALASGLPVVAPPDAATYYLACALGRVGGDDCGAGLCSNAGTSGEESTCRVADAVATRGLKALRWTGTKQQTRR